MDWGLFFTATGTILGCGVAIAGIIKLLVAREVGLKMNGIPHRLQTAERDIQAVLAILDGQPQRLTTAEHEIESLRAFRHDMGNRWSDVELLKREVFPDLPLRKPFRERDTHKG